MTVIAEGAEERIANYNLANIKYMNFQVVFVAN